MTSRYAWNSEGFLCTFGVIGECMLFVSFSRGKDNFNLQESIVKIANEKQH